METPRGEVVFFFLILSQGYVYREEGREGGGEKERKRERNIDRLPPIHRPGIKPET